MDSVQDCEHYPRFIADLQSFLRVKDAESGMTTYPSMVTMKLDTENETFSFKEVVNINDAYIRYDLEILRQISDSHPDCEAIWFWKKQERLRMAKKVFSDKVYQRVRQSPKATRDLSSHDLPFELYTGKVIHVEEPWIFGDLQQPTEYHSITMEFELTTTVHRIQSYYAHRPTDGNWHQSLHELIKNLKYDILRHVDSRVELTAEEKMKLRMHQHINQFILIAAVLRAAAIYLELLTSECCVLVLILYIDQRGITGGSGQLDEWNRLRYEVFTFFATELLQWPLIWFLDFSVPILYAVHRSPEFWTELAIEEFRTLLMVLLSGIFMVFIEFLPRQ